jgi:hypothetical protein
MRNVVVDASVVGRHLHVRGQEAPHGVQHLEVEERGRVHDVARVETGDGRPGPLVQLAQSADERAEATLDVLESLPIQRAPMHRALARRAGAHFANLSA